MKEFLQKLFDGISFEKGEMKLAVDLLLQEGTSESEVASFLTALKMKGETVQEISALVELLRERANFQPFPASDVMDICGTGGDGSQSFNISTTTAFVLAGAGVKVAKHGNRSVSSKTGSSDVLEHLGISLDFDSFEIQEMLESNGLAFLYAPYVHTRLKKVMKVRGELKIPTIFNMIGPLTNPVPIDTQLLGIYRRDMLKKMAMVLHELGRKRAVVLNGAGYMDEASLAGENHLVLLENGKVTEFTLSPEEAGLPVYSNEEIRGGDAMENTEILLQVLKGKEGAYLDTVLFNAGIALFANGKSTTIAQGVKLARESVQSGAAFEKLQKTVRYSQLVRKKVM
ncbi:anthranilate phosphoribosyltransferase [Rossellomorea vietnamensis]|uniref:Anthranilate phosphoribosyltransferase n=1 Tax=Rossellomorea vietnamensis TaxID=218284 RepID=A0A5D4NYX8_9BACI|nr:anthranilate phosphoribosyltransferase [Rossellomorea vietnamensis]TYS18748.1 anthranilate phosphoribosyltransferase [Rossellomorea vietnamensis]